MICTMSSQESSLMNARASFVNAVAEGINTLIQQCGYGRDRATSVLMRELSRGDSSRPSDNEIFDTMKRFGLGIEEASRTIVVTRALRRAMDTHATPEKAIEHLASKIAVKRLLYDSSEEDPTSDDDECPPISPNLRVKPISTTESKISSRTRTSSARHARLVANSNNTKAIRQRKVSTPSKPIFRKRTIDEMGSSDQSSESPDYSTTIRSRAESVSEEVSAKLQSNNDDPASETSSRPVRAKRSHRTEDLEPAGQSNSKRVRNSDA